MADNIRILLIRFSNPLASNEIALFRGAVISMMNQYPNILFHNHYEDGYRYRYPLIQYKIVEKNAALVSLNEGVDVILSMIGNLNQDVKLGHKSIKLEINSVKLNKENIGIHKKTIFYGINKWLPLNQSNFKKFQMLESLAEKSLFLETILTGNILSMAKGVGVFLEEQVICKIINFTEPQWIKYKDVNVLCVNATFKTNISMPDFISLGKGSSINYGTITRIKKL